MFRNKPPLRAYYTDEWTDLVSFERCDAANPCQKYVDETGKDFTHIYSYNKVMSREDRSGIANVLNKTNWRILAWYFDSKENWKCGLRDFKMLGKMSMQSTGDECFTVYVYFKTNRYTPGIEEAWLDLPWVDSDEEEEIKNEN